MATEADMVQAAKAWLDTKHGTLWSRAFDIGPEGSIDDAAVWFARQLGEFQAWVAESVHEES